MSQTPSADDAADPAWAGAARFLEGRIPPGGRVIAPDSFAHLAGALSAPDPEALPDWAVIRTTAAADLPSGLLRRLLAETTPVFANDGYVIFARRPTFGLADMRNAPAVRALADGAAIYTAPGASAQFPNPGLVEASNPRGPAAPEAAMLPLTPPQSPDTPRASLPPEALALQVPAPARPDRPAFPFPRPGTAAPEAPRLFVPPAAALPEPPRLFVPPAAPTPEPPRLFVPPPEPAGTPPEAPRPAAAPAGALPVPPALFAAPPLPSPASAPAPVPGSAAAAVLQAAPIRTAPPLPEPQSLPIAPPRPSSAEAPAQRGQAGTLPARIAALLGAGAGRRVAALGGEAPVLADAALAPSALISGGEDQPAACFDLALLNPDEASLAGTAAEAARLLRHGGVLLLVAENAESLGRRLAAALGRPGQGGLSASAIRGALHAAGLVIQRLEGHALDPWRATSDAPPPGLAAGDPAAAILEEAAGTMDPRHAAWLLFLARKP
ncbi:hypothetical protein VQH23_18510 [Pararoseomonas sp. SCSIO 73927]|uniref:hypothetical protein n=1 Tax=Pararoseomonas sp. SCSIO 73927 TaxID=3114537 RepID=UPI0030CE6706